MDLFATDSRILATLCAGHRTTVQIHQIHIVKHWQFGILRHIWHLPHFRLDLKTISLA